VEKHRVTDTLTLVFPLPLTQNQKNRIAYGSRHQYVRAKNKAKRAAWQSAVGQSEPPVSPPQRVTIHAHFLVKRRRDEDKLPASLEWILDALKQKQATEEISKHRFTREGIPVYLERGYFVDDDPKHLHLICTQDTARGREPCLTLRITPG
jgi:Holliday junction resolvase RusA-like endonuclease